jgi:tetratricopeptide (TPR) repeat protein
MDNAKNNLPCRFRKFLVLSLLVPVLLLAAVEGLCRLLFGQTELADRQLRVFEPSADGRLLVTKQGCLSAFHPLRIEAMKGEGTVRILCLGGSSTYGFPFGREAAFPRWLSDLLEHYHPNTRWEVLNLGAMSYGSRRILALVPEFLSLSPAAIVIYAGHNEFVDRPDAALGQAYGRLDWPDRLRLVQVLRQALSRAGDKDRAVDPEVYRETVVLETEEERERVVAAFRRNYEMVLRACKAKGVPVIASTVPSCLLDWRPDRSKRFRSGQGEAWSRHYEKGTQLLGQQALKDALAEFDAAAAIDPTYALLQYMRGECLSELGRYDEAKEAFELARDYDASPQRALRSINEAIRSAAEQVGACLVDFVDLFEQGSEHRLIGKKLVEDYVHPTILGHQTIAVEFYFGLARVLDLPVPVQASEESALNYLASLKKPEPAGADRAAFFYNLGLKFINQGNWPKVVEVNQQAVRCDPSHALAYNNLGRGYQQLGQWEEALDCFRKAAQLRPDMAGIHRNLGTAFQALKRQQEAIGAFRRAVQLRVDDPSAHYLLAISLADVGQMEDAIAEYETAVRLKPDYFEAQANLGLAYALTGQKDQARNAWKKALGMRPEDSVVKEWLRKLDEP